MCCEVDVGGPIGEVDSLGVVGGEVHILSLFLCHS